MEEKSCLNCIYGIYHHGSPATYENPEEPGEMDCKKEDEVNKNTTSEQWDEINELPEDEYYIKSATICGCYTPKIVEQCVNCKTTIMVPEYQHEHFVYCDGNKLGVCNERCEKEYNKKLSKLEAEMFGY